MPVNLGRSTPRINAMSWRFMGILVQLIGNGAENWSNYAGVLRRDFKALECKHYFVIFDEELKRGRN